MWFNCFVSFNHFLLIINASCNFLIYVSVGDKFKTTIDKFCLSKGFVCGDCLKSAHPSSPLEEQQALAAADPNGVPEENGKAIPLLPVSTATEPVKKPVSAQTISTIVSVTNKNQVSDLVFQILYLMALNFNNCHSHIFFL